MFLVFENELEKTISEEIQLYASKEYSSLLASTMLSKKNLSHTSISVDTMNLFESNIAFAHYIFQNPRRALKLLDDAFLRVSSEISKTHELKADMVYNGNLHVRLVALPNLPEVYRSNLPNCSDVGQFLCIKGTVVKASAPKILQFKKLWRCSKCKYQFIVEAEVEQGYICEKPAVCKNPDFCNGRNFTLMNTDTNVESCKDFQNIKLQEQVYNLSIGTVPRSMWVVLEDDLVETCHPGNDVIVSGILIQQWKPLIKGSPIDIELVILAHNIEVQNKMASGVVSKDIAQEFQQFWHSHKSNPLSGRNFILSSICPQVFGLYVVKLALALILAGGVQKKNGNSRIRGDSHLLLVGDPGTAKSQFLKFANKVSPRSVITSGIGTTNAGLTVSAVKESGRWELEAGALVLADGGICCIDEFSCIKEQDKTCIHEAMEQQTISVAKAGLVCSLNTRCSIVAATNPKGKYDEAMSLSENTALGTPLLSRFDIILVLLDTYDSNWDDMVASYILHGRNVSNEKKSSLWSISKLKSYFILIRHINPKMSPQAERILRSYYTKQRSLESRNTSRTTPRLLQSLIRLAEGHARLMLRTKVLILDAVIAVILVDSSMLGNSILEGLSPLHTVFPDNPTAEYVEKAEKVFQNLNVEINLEEDFGYFYEESCLQNLLHDISVVWTSKDSPYLFENTSCDETSNSDVFQDDNTCINETYVNEDASEDLYHKNAQRSNICQNSSPIQQILLTETHEDTAISTTKLKELNHQVSTLSDLRNIFCTDITEKETTVSENLSILDHILEKQNENECTDIEFLQNNTNQRQVKRQFLNLTDTEEKVNYDGKQGNLSENGSSKNFTNSNFERSNNEILEELGIIRENEEEIENMQIDQPTTSFKECFKPLPDNSSTVNKIFPFKRPLADQFKKFAFSKSHFSSHQKRENNKNMSNVPENSNVPGTSSLVSINNTGEKLKNSNVPGTSSLVNINNTGEKLKNSNIPGTSSLVNINNTGEKLKNSNIPGTSSLVSINNTGVKLTNCNYTKSCEIMNKTTNKKSAFKMIVDRYKSSQNNVTGKEDESTFNTSQILYKSQHINKQNYIQDNKISDEDAENKNESTNAIKNQDCQTTEEHSSKEQVPNKLKMFLFTKNKTSKSSKNSDSIDEK